MGGEGKGQRRCRHLLRPALLRTMNAAQASTARAISPVLICPWTRNQRILRSSRQNCANQALAGSCGQRTTRTRDLRRQQAQTLSRAVWQAWAVISVGFIQSTRRPSISVLCGPARRSVSDLAQNDSRSCGWNLSNNRSKQLTGAKHDLDECQVLGVVAENSDRT